MLVTTEQQRQIMYWHMSHGGFAGSLAKHALRSLHEMVELCIASGANPSDIVTAVAKEIVKATDRGEVGKFDRDKFEDEVADTLITMVVLTSYGAAAPNEAIDAKIPILKQRTWKPDEAGVLWRADKSGEAK